MLSLFSSPVYQPNTQLEEKDSVWTNLNLVSKVNDDIDFRTKFPERSIEGGGNWNTDEIMSWLVL